MHFACIQERKRDCGNGVYTSYFESVGPRIENQTYIISAYSIKTDIKTIPTIKL